MNFSVIIPTYKRKDDLQACMQSIYTQTRTPQEVLIIDDDSLPKKYVETLTDDCKRKDIDLIYHKKDHTKNPRGSSESRNMGIKLATNEICFILDDDLILDTGFFEHIMDVWGKNEDKQLLGVGGIITNNRKRGTLERIYGRVFNLNATHCWDVNDIAFQSWNDWIPKRERGYYVHGGVCSYKKALVEKIGSFATFTGGRTALEDVDFCLKAKQAGYHFEIEPEAQVIHNHSPSGRENHFRAGYKEARNRKEIFQTYCKNTIQNTLLFIWANVGWILKQCLTGQFSKAAGMIEGVCTTTK